MKKKVRFLTKLQYVTKIIQICVNASKIMSKMSKCGSQEKREGIENKFEIFSKN